MTKFGERLIASANEALAIAEGRAIPAKVVHGGDVDIVAIRKGQKLTQVEFARRYGLSLSTLRDWEYGRRSPDAAALTLLRVIDREPEAVMRSVSASRAA
ncbi:Putative transcriptional regulator [Hyphomicrobiales bacterium]|nr:Putative transcriptional regulator [Hyphomicrobiales bacterium]